MRSPSHGPDRPARDISHGFRYTSGISERTESPGECSDRSSAPRRGRARTRSETPLSQQGRPGYRHVMAPQYVPHHEEQSLTGRPTPFDPIIEDEEPQPSRWSDGSDGFDGPWDDHEIVETGNADLAEEFRDLKFEDQSPVAPSVEDTTCQRTTWRQHEKNRELERRIIRSTRHVSARHVAESTYNRAADEPNSGTRHAVPIEDTRDRSRDVSAEYLEDVLRPRNVSSHFRGSETRHSKHKGDRDIAEAEKGGHHVTFAGVESRRGPSASRLAKDDTDNSSRISRRDRRRHERRNPSNNRQRLENEGKATSSCPIP